MSLYISDLAGTLQEFFTVAGGFVFKKLSSATAATSGYLKLYFKTDSNLYMQDENGIETQIATGDVAPDIVNIESNQSIIGWDVYSTETLLDDVNINSFKDQSGVDTVLSSNENYDAGNDWWRASLLVTCAWEASILNPSIAYCIVRIEPQESYTLGTDFQAHISTTDGVFYEEFEEWELFREIGNSDFIRGDISVLSAMGDQTIRFKLAVNNSKDIPIAAISLGVKD
jgi:hypothetical protein